MCVCVCACVCVCVCVWWGLGSRDPLFMRRNVDSRSG